MPLSRGQPISVDDQKLHDMLIKALGGSMPVPPNLSLSLSLFCLSVLLSFCPSVLLSFCPSVLLSFCLSVFLSSFCLSVFLSFCLSVFLSFCLSVFLSFCLSVFLSFCLSVFLSFCPSVFLLQHDRLCWVHARQCDVQDTMTPGKITWKLPSPYGCPFVVIVPALGNTQASPKSPQKQIKLTSSGQSGDGQERRSQS